MLVCFSAGTVFCLLLRLFLIQENKKKTRACEVAGTTVLVVGGHEVSEAVLNLIDQTDRELDQFRYVY